MNAFHRGIALSLCGVLIAVSLAAAQGIDDPTGLAREAREHGDAARGAIVFFQPFLACSKCHPVGESNATMLGPDLTTISQDLTDEGIVESLLLPSKLIRKGYEQVVVTTTDGRTIQGPVIKRSADQWVVRDLTRGGERVELGAADIELAKTSDVSMMPAGQIEQLASRQQLLDLLRYLFEIRTGGAARARELQPSPTLLTLTPPEYEQHLDHAGLIRDWNAKSLERGEAIYRRVCQNCHGTKDQPGSLPTSLRFADGKFKNGSDPLAMYHTLTRGFGLMAAQTWMVPSQKYDVIHYIRETYLRPHNALQFVNVDENYLARLPKGDTRGPEPSKIEPWSAMDYGPSLTHTYEIPGDSPNFAYKGIAARLDPGAGGVARGSHWMIFDTDTLRAAAGWSLGSNKPRFINWRGIQFNGEHQIHPQIAGEIVFANKIAPGWANPETDSFRDDQRVLGRDGRRYGPLPRHWGRFRGTYHHEQDIVLSYTVGKTQVLESPRMIWPDPARTAGALVRVFNIGKRDRKLILQVADKAEGLRVAVSPDDGSVQMTVFDKQYQLQIPAGEKPLQFALCMQQESAGLFVTSSMVQETLDFDLSKLTSGGPPRWPPRITTRVTRGEDRGPFAVDVLTAPDSNPWLAQPRFTGLDFQSDGRLVACTWDGDVWVVEMNSAELVWQRIASGLFQPLGLKVIRDKIHVLCRDQLAVLHDLNGDGETDYYECLNNDHQVTEHFHEFAMGLQTDAAGNFYYAKSARHALPALVPHHGTLLRVSPDGSRTDILANGFRAANGVCLNPDGSFVVTDQEGHWNPKNRINWVTCDASGKPKFYGNLFGYTDVTDPSDAAMEPPLCWITNSFDRSPAELLWVDSDRWGPLKGTLLNLSYGYGKIFVVPHEQVNGKMQGGMLELPLPLFPTGIMRGRFHPADGGLYVCGMFAWAGNATQPGGLYRVRATGKPMHLVTGLHAKRSGLELAFTDPLDPASIKPDNVAIKIWTIRRTKDYGSKHFDEKTLPVAATSLSADGKTLSIDIRDIAPTWCMEIAYSLRGATGEPVVGKIHNTVHELRE